MIAQTTLDTKFVEADDLTLVSATRIIFSKDVSLSNLKCLQTQQSKVFIVALSPKRFGELQKYHASKLASHDCNSAYETSQA